MKAAHFFGLIMLIGISTFMNPLLSQETGKSLSLEDIYKDHVYGQDGYGPVRWMKDNKGYSTLEYNEETQGKDIVRYDARTGKNSVLVSSTQLIPSGKSTALATYFHQYTACLALSHKGRLLDSEPGIRKITAIGQRC